MKPPVTVEPHDEIIIAGRACLPRYAFRNLRATVEAVSMEGSPSIKVRPHDGQPNPDGTGRIWFFWADVDAIEVIEKGSEP